ncbi:restriction endonuclease subunit S [Robbsia andropogonis]|uniref:restriction endonuclease subunit S n=1 Tax=Robbsia andropogonis TaxID=28092 RepID=UPI000466F310|nr:restriction endonuclease subunit S [Robbsia andropogonis]
MKLTEGFNLLATAPDGIKRLRELILSLAVQGKLVPQDPKDEPASVLLKKVRAEKDRLIAEGTIKKGKPLPAINDDEPPFDLPNGWDWVRLGSLIELISGQHLGPMEYKVGLESGIPYLTGPAEFGEISPTPTRSTTERRAVALAGDILITVKGSGVGKLNVTAHAEIAISRQLMAIRPIYTNASYLMLVLQTRGAQFQAQSVGIAIPGIGRDDVTLSVIGLPPLSEQSRIVAKVEELMSLCDALETRGRLEAEQHARLTATLFDALAASKSAHQLQENWTRLASNFDLILDRPEAVDALEQTLLQLAVRGLLVEQAPNDEPASELLKLIRAEKDRLIAEGKIKRDKSKPVSFDDAPYELPETWGWTTIGEISSSMGSGWSPACLAEPQAAPEQWAVLKTTAVQLMEYQAWQNKLLPSNLQPRPEIEAQNGDILITRAGPRNRVGISCLVQNTPARLMISDKIVRFHVLGEVINPQFVVLCLNAGWSYQRLDAAKSGMAESQVNISQGDLKDIPVPVCTPAEQSRIVACVEALRALCAALKDRLTAGQTIQTRFAEALVENAA